MADRAEKAMKQVKNEGSNGDSDDDVPISAINKGKKKVEDSDDDEVPLAVSRARMKSAESRKGGEKRIAMPSKAKKEESGGSKEDMEKKVKKRENKKENIKEKDKPSSSSKVKKEKVKKIYDLPGQKHDPPEERDPLRIFYESLYNQNPNSEMAQVWMMEKGLLPEDEARNVFEKKKQKGIASPAKPTPAKKSPVTSSPFKRSLDTNSTKKGKAGTSKDNPAKNKKRKVDSDSEMDSDDDFIAPSKQNPRKKQKVSN